MLPGSVRRRIGGPSPLPVSRRRDDVVNRRWPDHPNMVPTVRKLARRMLGCGGASFAVAIPERPPASRACLTLTQQPAVYVSCVRDPTGHPGFRESPDQPTSTRDTGPVHSHRRVPAGEPPSSSFGPMGCPRGRPERLL